MTHAMNEIYVYVNIVCHFGSLSLVGGGGGGGVMVSTLHTGLYHELAGQLK
jgi:hypothetical protein